MIRRFWGTPLPFAKPSLLLISTCLGVASQTEIDPALKRVDAYHLHAHFVRKLEAGA